MDQYESELKDKNIKLNIHNLEHIKYYANQYLINCVFSNLLDNAIKYSIDKHITVNINENRIEIINNGEELKEPLENYFKPFHTSKSGLGLGIYIVKSILDIHHRELEYRYENGKNIFVVT
jgi:two-component system OmpR family sensor kinase